MTTRPPKSMRFVCGPESALTSLVLPAAMMSSPLIARASTYGRAELLVKILPLSKIKLGDGCCATHGHWTKKKARAATRYLGTIFLQAAYSCATPGGYGPFETSQNIACPCSSALWR